MLREDDEMPERKTYWIWLYGGDDETTVEMDLTAAEYRTIQRLADKVMDGRGRYQPEMTITEKPV